MKTRIILKRLNIKCLTLMIVSIAIAFAFTACGDDDDNRVDHTGEIEAFDRTINVVGDKNISAADFAKAVGNLQTAMSALDTALSGGSNATRFINMFDIPGFKILITTSASADPAANSDKNMMTIGVGYLLDDNDIDVDLYALVVTGRAFEDSVE